MKKALIVTWFMDCNYGQVLQAYAMSEIFKHLGYEPYLLKYKKLEKSGVLHFYLDNLEYNKFTERPLRKVLFQSFVTLRLNATHSCNSIEDVRAVLDKEQFDLFVCGSDQIWNPDRYDPVLTLEFGDGYHQKRIAYAPSVMSENQIEYYKKTFDKMKENITKIDYLSVREKSGCNIIEQLVGRKVEHVLDPTLLLTKKIWANRLGIRKRSTNQYMFCYIMGGSQAHKRQLNKIKKHFNIEEVISIFGVDEVTYGDKTYSNLGPIQFLDLLYNATVVCTDSFHGVAFSINFEKEFFAFDRKQKSARKKHGAFKNTDRIASLLNILDLNRRLIEQDDIIDMEPISYKEINASLRRERKKSWKYLHQVKE